MSTKSASTNLPSPAAAPAGRGPNVLPFRIAQVYLELQKRRLHFLNDAALQLRAEGVPFTRSDLARQILHDSEGRITEMSRLPLLVAAREGRPVEAAFTLIRDGQDPATVWWSAVPHKGENGEPLGVFASVCILAGEPDWKALAGLAHDLRTPLNALTLLTDVLEAPERSEAGLRENLADLRAALTRALHVSTDLLTFCRGSTQHEVKLTPSWFFLEPLLQRLAREQTPAAERKGLQLAYEGAPAADWEIYTDPVRLGRLLSNLLVNAVRYTPSGRVAFSASWRAEPTGRTLVLSVVDTGIGISDDEQESIFEPFERGQAVKEDDSGGSGLGLAIVDRLVEELGLELEVYSEYGRGSAFHLLVPWRLLRPKSSVPTAPMVSGDTHHD